MLVVREIALVVGLAVVLSLAAKTWLVQSFWIPSDSMNDTLVRDDRVLVSKLTPGPLDLQRGDIVVFEDPAHWLRTAPVATASGNAVQNVLSWVGLMPNDAGNHLIKRLIGLPGDHVRCCTARGKVAVNGVEVTEPYLYPGNAPSEMDFDVTVPPDSVWVMGDHRADSSDSRYNDTADVAQDVTNETTLNDPKNHTGFYGSVPMERIVGKSFAIVWPLPHVGLLNTGGEAFSAVPASGGPAPVAPANAPRRESE